MYRRYTLDEVKHKIIDVLQNQGTGLSGIELADKTEINRMTITKYLDVLYTMGLVKKKKVGSVNVWFLETGVADIEFPINHSQIQQKLMNAVLGGEESQARTIIISVLNSAGDKTKILTEVILPIANTIIELYNRGRLDKTERILLLNVIYELISLVKFNVHVQDKDIKAGAHVMSVAGSEDMVYVAKSTAVAFHILGWSSTYIGNVEDHIDPFFDIDFQRYISKRWGDKRGMMILCLFSSGEGSLRFMSSIIKTMKGRVKGELRLVVYTTAELQHIAEEAEVDYLAKDMQSVVDWAEREYSARKR